MKIAVTGTRGIPHIMGGVETHCEELFPRLAAMGFDVTVMRRNWYAHDDLTEWNGVKLIDIKTPRRKSFEAIIHTMKAILKARSIGAEVVHIHAIGPALLTPLARLLGMRVVFTHHGPDYDRDKWGTAAKIMLKAGERMGARYANEVIVISDVIREILERKYNRCDTHLIYNGVPDADFCDYPEYFEELGIEKDRYILSMCRFVPEKKLEHLVEAYTKLKETGNDKGIRLVLAGDADFEDDYSRRLKQMAAASGVVLTGFVKGRKLHSLLTGARCFVLPSSHEGLPIALLEAMRYGLPAILSDIPANLEVGLPKDSYYHLGDVDALSKKLQQNIMSEPTRKDYDMSKYDWDHIALQVAEVYRKANDKRKNK